MSCGFEPIYGTNKPADLIMGKIDVEVSNGRNAFEFRDRLIERLGALDGTPTYLLKYTSNIESKNLTISKDNDVTRYTLQGETNFDLVDMTSKKVIYTIHHSLKYCLQCDGWHLPNCYCGKRCKCKAFTRYGR